MERENLTQPLSRIKEIEKDIEKLSEMLSNSSIFSRNEMLQQIFHDILKNDRSFKAIGIVQDDFFSPLKVQQPEFFFDFSIFEQIRKDPGKKLKYLSEFLDLFEEISEKDKTAILQSFNDKSIEEINKDMISLVEIFKLKI